MKSITELREMTIPDLENLIYQIRKDQFKLRLVRTQDPQQVKSHQFSELRRSVAQVKTIMTEKNRKDA